MREEAIDRIVQCGMRTAIEKGHLQPDEILLLIFDHSRDREHSRVSHLSQDLPPTVVTQVFQTMSGDTAECST